ncbi:MAG: hypothetical protein WBO98_03980 [Candidatus Nitrotoga sp.]
MARAGYGEGLSKDCRYGFLLRQRQQYYISTASHRSEICFANTREFRIAFQARLPDKMRNNR